MTAQAACVNAYHSLTPELKAMGCLCTTDHLEEMVAMQQDVARRLSACSQTTSVVRGTQG